MIKKILSKVGNWETIAFILIQDCITGTHLSFSRSDLMTIKHLDIAVIITAVSGHKKRPMYPDKTLQRTIQNMRDKGLIDFLGGGEYRLTKSGLDKMQIVAEKFPYQEISRDLKSHDIIR